MTMPKKTIEPETPIIEVAPACEHVRATEMKQDDTTRAFLVRNYCPKCGWSGNWVKQSEAILSPVELPVVERF
jgi:hypothetical protein